ncbi:TIGR04282 family arsenosugar biosynthesis glycosyltransferase [Mariniflexile sp.]|uniref:TIGR04282 family arsenosugar biosynthesis glycosyltransferase n=1 Tax=Mariniflexile sp. TaxID=1979402 RepID=UPI004047A9E6
MGLFSTKETNDGHEAVFDFHFPTSKKAIIIFTRTPELGTCKTRLAKTVGDEAALDIYKFLLKHTAMATEPINADKYVFYSEKIKKEDAWDESVFIKKLQNGDDLGTRMENAFMDLFGLGYQKVIIIGSDLLDLNPTHLNDAFEKLNEHEVVIGPAKDGGYYLLGLSKFNACIFQNKPWSEPHLLETTLEELAQKSVSLALLETLNDIDAFEDLKDYPQLKKFYAQHD